VRWIPFCLSAALAFAQGTKPKASASGYDVHAQAGALDIGAEYMVHSFSAGEQMFIAEDYLVVEVALYPLMKDDPVTVDLNHLKLRLNGKTVIPADQPAQAAASLTRSRGYVPRTSGMSGGIGVGPLGIPVGQQPGGPPVQRGPAPPRAPEADPGSGVTREVVKPDEVLMNTALPEGPQKGRIAGFVFFPYRGKTSSIKSLVLEFEGASLKLK